MTHRKAAIDFPSDLEIRIKRRFDAPRELVFDCATRPEHLARWWGPRTHELIVCEVDLRVGGSYRFVLRTPDGQEAGFHGEFLELVRPERLRQTFIFEPYPDHGAVETMTLEEVDGGTLWTTVIKHKTRDGRDGMFNAGMEGGMNDSHARLDDLLDELSKAWAGPAKRRTQPGGHPTLGNGKVCYIEIPATDIDRSAQFYAQALGWKIRRRSDGQLAFDDGVGEVSGTWVTGRAPSTDPGLMIYIMVASVTDAMKAVTANGGRIVQPLGVDAPEITARFSDPAGNVLGLYQDPA